MQEAIDIKELNDRINRESSFIDLINKEISKVIVGQKHLTDSKSRIAASNNVNIPSNKTTLNGPITETLSVREFEEKL